MRLNNEGLKDRSAWEAAGYMLPSYDRDAVTKNTMQNPFWIHFGAGNIFRAYQANVVQNLLNSGVIDRGLIAAEGYDYEIIEKMNTPHDSYSILVTFKADGTIEKSVTGSIVESLCVDSKNEKDFGRLKEIFTNSSLQMATFTITEKGYSLNDAHGNLLANVKADFENGPSTPESYLGKVTALLYARFSGGGAPVAMVSMDNCSHNGDVLFEAISRFGKEWAERGLVANGFVEYISNPKLVSFPWTMIDKITPRPDTSVKDILTADGVEDMEQIVTTKDTYIAPFVNAEECEYLVIEDSFPNGRPSLENGGLIFTTRETVDKVEKMKVCTCLNPLHTALGIFGCLLGYTLISKEMEEPSLRRLVEIIGYDEGLPVVVNPGIIDPKAFIDEVINVRIPNPFMPDSPQRITTDTSKKMAVRFGETIKAYIASDTLDVADLKLIPLVIAGWARYLMAVDDKGKPFTLDTDPMLESLCPHVANISLGGSPDTLAALEPILRNKEIFGLDLVEAGLADVICGYFNELIAAPGAVAATLKKYTRVN